LTSFLFGVFYLQLGIGFLQKAKLSVGLPPFIILQVGFSFQFFQLGCLLFEHIPFSVVHLALWDLDSHIVFRDVDSGLQVSRHVHWVHLWLLLLVLLLHLLLLLLWLLLGLAP
jgi:hypothetical protein